MKIKIPRYAVMLEFKDKEPQRAHTYLKKSQAERAARQINARGRGRQERAFVKFLGFPK